MDWHGEAAHGLSRSRMGLWSCPQRATGCVEMSARPDAMTRTGRARSGGDHRNLRFAPGPAPIFYFRYIGPVGAGAGVAKGFPSGIMMRPHTRVSKPP